MNTEMNGELNGRAEGVYGNDMDNWGWAGQVARRILQAPWDGAREQISPTDLFVAVAEILAGSRDLSSLASLNSVSRPVHEGTLPVLYETLIFADAQAFERSMISSNPKGWKYVKFLFVTSVTLPLLRLHLRYQADDNPACSEDEFATAFPRLVLLGFTDVTSPPRPANHDHPLHVTLYKPIHLAALLRACIHYGGEGSRFGKQSGISFLGTYYLRQTGPGTPVRVRLCSFRDIVRLDIRPGGCILREKGWQAQGMEGWHATYLGASFKYGVNFELEVAEGVEETRMQETTRTILDHLSIYASSKQVTAQNKSVTLKVKCDSQRTKKFIKLVSSWRQVWKFSAVSLLRVCHLSVGEQFAQVQPYLFNLDFNITNPVTKKDMKRYLLALGSAYAQGWPAQAHAQDPLGGRPLFQIVAPGHGLHPPWMQDYELENEPDLCLYRMQLEGEALYGVYPDWDRASDDESEGQTGDETTDDSNDDMSTAGNLRARRPLHQRPGPPANDAIIRSGFSVELSRALYYKQKYQDSDILWKRAFPVALPVPVLPPAGPVRSQVAPALPLPAPSVTVPGPLGFRGHALRIRLERFRRNPALAQRLFGIDQEIVRQVYRLDTLANALPRPYPVAEAPNAHLGAGVAAAEPHQAAEEGDTIGRDLQDQN
ncbi:hypothetical protein QFC22_006201 [Naganishia vaughanmartiniae]|uniref:Uncharacterized protein n=1 Tax=Naganishia vaughanmartiniae TaxID=1424756 RepID=A0ACC2WNB6_9TREE|nr:hypothetical protein QFC22_006201 [Naganishia vaughanmartiniae]